MAAHADSQSTTVELFISCRNLKDMDILSKSDPVVEVSSSVAGGAWRVLGKTECIQNNLNPDFATSFSIRYYFEKMTTLKFRVVDIDTDDQDLDKGDFLGGVSLSLHEIVGAKNQKITKDLESNEKKEKVKGCIIVRIEEVTQGNDFLEVEFHGKDLKKVVCALCDNQPFYEISRMTEDGNFQLVYRSTTLKGSTCFWRPMMESLAKICNNDQLRPLKFAVYHANSNGNNAFIGSNEVNVSQWLEGGVKEFVIKGSDKRTVVGTIQVAKINLRRDYSFLDYITAGFEINMMAAVDFTASNGNPSEHTSLHYISSTPNEYESALRAVGEIVLCYDSDKLVPMYGFGGVFNAKTSHAFPLNQNEGNPEVYQLDGMIDTYKQALNKYSLSGPTKFSAVLSKAVEEAREIQQQKKRAYVILLILTDGVIHDMSATTDCVVAGSQLPLSIIIVGVGNENFSQMNELDADETPLRDSSGRLMARDIVQFVPYRECSRDIHRLRDEVLAEVPNQLTSYFKKEKIFP